MRFDETAPATPTPQTPALTALEKAAESFHCLLLVECDSQWMITRANRALAALLELLPEQLEGRRLLELLTPGSRRTLLDRVAGAEREISPMRLHLLTRGDNPRAIRALLQKNPEGGCAVLAEPLQDEEIRLHREMMELNNRLANLTRENARKKRELEVALRDLKEAQAMLVHREKMASLGQMTAGIAHEINNPVAFVLNNQFTLKRDFEDLIGFAERVAQLRPTLERLSPESAVRIDEAAEEADIDYLVGAVPKKIEANLDGLRRVKQLVLDLRSFSRLDEAEIKEGALADGIRESIRFLAPMIRESEVELEADLDEVPPVRCEHAAVNQAVSNILSNAIQASRAGQTVRVSLKAISGEQLITIRDEGEGIPGENLDRIFDPFFTTKPVGSGTGLGLSIVHGIVERQGGTIRVKSEPGAGTEVEIHLPLSASGGTGHDET